MDTFCTAVGAVFVFTDRTVNDHDLVGRAFLVSGADPSNERHKYQNDGTNQNNNFVLHKCFPPYM